jgi:hypothetical protein
MILRAGQDPIANRIFDVRFHIVCVCRCIAEELTQVPTRKSQKLGNDVKSG